MGAIDGACGASALRALRARFCALRARFFLSFFFLFWMWENTEKVPCKAPILCFPRATLSGDTLAQGDTLKMDS